MAKKFAAIGGLHTIFNLDTDTNEYDLSTFLDESVDHNTICFISADEDDIDKIIVDHTIKENDRFIIVQNDVFSLYGSLEQDIDIEPNTWRPIQINGVPVTTINTTYDPDIYNRDTYTYTEDEQTITVSRVYNEELGDYSYTKMVDDGEPQSATLSDFTYAQEKAIEQHIDVYPEEPFDINYEDSEYIKVGMTYDEVLKVLSLKYEFDIQAALDFIRSNIDFPYVGDGALIFDIPNEEVHTDNPLPREVVVEDEQNEEPQTETVITGTASLKPNTITIDGSFSANQSDGSTVTIRYTGNADRVDWYAEGDTRNESDLNESTAKKFVYIECMQEYFNSRQDYPYIELNDKGKQMISEDSIVFITCGTLKKETAQEIKYITDAEAFGNPEYLPGARFIWTHNKMFSANTWMPIFTRETEQHELKGITPIIGSTPYGGRLIFQGAGGIKVDNTINDDNTTGTHDRIITIDGSGIGGGGGSGGTVYTTDVLVKQDIPLGGTLLGNSALAEHLFSDYGDKVPANMTLHEVLRRLLYKEAPIVPFYIGTIGVSSTRHFNEDDDITQFVTDHVYIGTDIPSDATIAFRKYSEDRIVDGYTKRFIPSSEFQMENHQVPAELQEPSQLVIIVPKSSFNTAQVVDNNWLKVEDPNWGDWTSQVGSETAYWRSRVVIDGIDYYIWYLYPRLTTDAIYSSNKFDITFFTH